MQIINDLTEKEQILIEFSSFEYDSIKNLIDYYASDVEMDWNTEHVNRIIKEYTEKYVKLQAVANEIAKSRGVQNIVSSWDYKRDTGLILY